MATLSKSPQFMNLLKNRIELSAWKRWRLEIAIVIALFALAGVKILTRHPSVTLTTGLELFLTTSHAPISSLRLTDVPTSLEGNFSVLSKTSPILEIPLNSNETNVALQFRIIAKREFPLGIEGLETIVVLPKSSQCNMNQGWYEEPGSPYFLMHQPDLKEFRSESPKTLPPGDSTSLPLIIFSASQPRSEMYGDLTPFFLTVTAQNTVPTRLAFWLLISKLPPGLTGHFLPRIVSRQQLTKLPDGSSQMPVWP